MISEEDLRIILLNTQAYTRDGEDRLKRFEDSIPDIVKALKFYHYQLYPCSNGCCSLSVGQVIKLEEIKQRLDNEINNTIQYYSRNLPDSVKSHIKQCLRIKLGKDIVDSEFQQLISGGQTK